MDNKEEKEIIEDTTKEEVIDENDVVFDDEDGGMDINSIKKIREKLKKCVEEKQEYLDGWQRAKADFINARKRDEEAKSNFLKFAKEDIIVQIIPVLDSFEMAFSNKEAWEKSPKEWRLGIEYIYSQLLSVVTGNGVKQLDPLGEAFDPNRHTSVETVIIDQKEKDGSIIFVVQKGYELNGKIIREAKVKVGEYKSG